MSRREARERIANRGDLYHATAKEDTDLLVVGQGGPPLGDDGKLTQSLARAHELRAGGSPIRIVDEDEFLSQIGLEERRSDLQRLFTGQQLQRILGVTSRELRSWVRSDLIQPVRIVNRLCFFDFQQVATARTLSRLHGEGVGVKRIRKSLEDLGRWLPGSDQALGQLESIERGGPLLVRTGEGQLAETSGQLRMEFEDVAPPATIASERVAPKGPRPGMWISTADRNERSRADQLFDRGMQAEADGDLEAAADLYVEALALGGPEAEIAFNLGNTLYALERLPEAVEHFEQATQADSSYVEAWNNMGNVLSQLGQAERAVSAYRRALSLAPDYADAHFNLAETLAGMGALREARRHWEAYLVEDPHSSTAREVRERLEELQSQAPE